MMRLQEANLRLKEALKTEHAWVARVNSNGRYVYEAGVGACVLCPKEKTAWSPEQAFRLALLYFDAPEHR